MTLLISAMRSMIERSELPVAATSRTPWPMSAITPVIAIVVPITSPLLIRSRFTSHMTNEAGRLIVRVSKTYQGHRVWGAAGIIHID